MGRLVVRLFDSVDLWRDATRDEVAFVSALAPKSFRAYGASAQANAGSTTESRFHSIIKKRRFPYLTKYPSVLQSAV
jgi:hypothetical protein